MTEYNNINWDNLKHAYGVASDIPKLIKQLSEYPVTNNHDSEPFFTLWSSLCHQGDVYSASYVAVPEIVSLIEAAPEKVTYNYFLLPICIEIARVANNGPSLTNEIEFMYKSAIKKLGKLTTKISNPDDTFIMVLSATLAVANGNTSLGEAILELTPDLRAGFMEWVQDGGA